MKKAKIMLVAIAALTVVGGTLAFSAKKYSTDKLYYYTITQQNTPSVCVSKNFLKTTEDGSPVAIPGTGDGWYTTTAIEAGTGRVICDGQQFDGYNSSL